MVVGRAEGVLTPTSGTTEVGGSTRLVVELGSTTGVLGSMTGVLGGTAGSSSNTGVSSGTADSSRCSGEWSGEVGDSSCRNGDWSGGVGDSSCCNGDRSGEVGDSSDELHGSEVRDVVPSMRPESTSLAVAVVSTVLVVKRCQSDSAGITHHSALIPTIYLPARNNSRYTAWIQLEKRVLISCAFSAPTNDSKSRPSLSAVEPTQWLEQMRKRSRTRIGGHLQVSDRLSAQRGGWACQPNDPLGSTLPLRVPEYVDEILSERRYISTSTRTS